MSWSMAGKNQTVVSLSSDDSSSSSSPSSSVSSSGSAAASTFSSLPPKLNLDPTNAILAISSLAFFGGLTSALILSRRRLRGRGGGAGSILSNEARTERWLRRAAEKKRAESNGALNANEEDLSSGSIPSRKDQLVVGLDSIGSNPNPPSVLMRSRSFPQHQSQPQSQTTTRSQSRSIPINQDETQETQSDRKSGYPDVMKAFGIATSLLGLTSFLVYQGFKFSLGARDAQELTDKLRNLIPRNPSVLTREEASKTPQVSSAPVSQDHDPKESKFILEKPLPRSEVFKRLDQLASKADSNVKSKSKSSPGHENGGDLRQRNQGKEEVAGEEEEKGLELDSEIEQESTRERERERERARAREEWIQLLVAQLDAESKLLEEEREKRSRQSDG